MKFPVRPLGVRRGSETTVLSEPVGSKPARAFNGAIIEPLGAFATLTGVPIAEACWAETPSLPWTSFITAADSVLASFAAATAAARPSGVDKSMAAIFD